MNGATTQRPVDQSSTPRVEVIEGLRRIKVGALVGMASQTVIWSSVITLVITGSLLSQIPAAATIIYGANTFTVSAGEIFAVNYVLILGVIISLISFVYYLQGFKRVEETIPSFGEVPLMTLLGVIGSGLLATGWALWLGSFVSPGSGYASDAYTSHMDSSIGILVWLLLYFGVLLIFIGILGISLGNYGIGVAYREKGIESGGVLSALPILSVIGQFLCLVGSVRAENKIAAGWSPPPPPQVVHSPAMVYQTAYPPGTTVIVTGEQRSSDPVVAILAVFLFLMWIFILPTILFSLLDNSYLPLSSSGSAASSGAASLVFPVLLLFIGVIVTVLLVALIVVRKRRRKTPSERNPPPPAPPPKQVDLLDHLV